MSFLVITDPFPPGFYWRTDSETPVILWGLKQAQLTSLAVLLLVVPVFVATWLRSRRLEATRFGDVESVTRTA